MLPKTSSRWPPNLGLLSPLRARCDTEIPSERASASKAHSKPLHVKSQPSPRLFHPKPLHAVPSLQFFSTTPLYLKKSQRDEPNRTVQLAFARSKAADDNPYDFSALEADIASALDRLEDDLSKLKPGGRFNPDVLDGLRVNLVKGSKESIKLGDLAQVVPRSGRTIVVLVGEADVSHCLLLLDGLRRENISNVGSAKLILRLTSSTSNPSPPPSSPRPTRSTLSPRRTRRSNCR